MNIDFTKQFDKDLDKIKLKTILESIDLAIKNVESVSKISEIKNLKKLKGSKTAYRIKVGDYRLGLILENKVAVFVRFVHRKDIYKVFP